MGKQEQVEWAIAGNRGAPSDDGRSLLLSGVSQVKVALPGAGMETLWPLAGVGWGAAGIIFNILPPPFLRHQAI